MTPTAFDFHVHAGNERGPHAQRAFFDGLRLRDVRYAGILDHAEFYMSDTSPWMRNFRRTAAEKGYVLYEDSVEGLKAFYRDLDTLRRSEGLAVAMGLEFRHPEAIPEAFMELPEYFSNCYHIPPLESGKAMGLAAAAMIERFGERIRPYGKPGIVNHPFRDRFGPYDELVAAGKRPRPEAFVPADEIDRMVAAAQKHGLFIEINLGDLSYHTTRSQAAALCLHTTRYLVESGVALSLGSDTHVPDVKTTPAVLAVLAEAGFTAERLLPLARTLNLNGGNLDD